MHDARCLDYHAVTSDPEGGLDPGLAADGVHPTPERYAVVAPLARAVIEHALGRHRPHADDARGPSH